MHYLKFIYFSDETTTPERQPEFTQLDIELSFTDSEKIIALVENILQNSWPKELGTLPATFNRITFEEAMDRYGSDKPDMRYKEFQVTRKKSKNSTSKLARTNFECLLMCISDGKHH